MNTLFFILGFLDEYNGRHIVENDDRVEIFYGDEKDKAEIFKTYLAKLAEEIVIDPTINVEVNEGGHITFYSRELSALINSYYVCSFLKSVYVVSDSQPKCMEAFIKKEIFGHANAEEKLSYITGAYARYGKGNVFRLANSSHKLDIIGELLKELGCQRVELAHVNPGYVPAIYELVFEPSGEVNQWLVPFQR
jgi:hypothetical protein